MFGVFSPYELQAIQDWLRGDASADGAPVPDTTTGGGLQRPRSFRAQQRLAAARMPAVTTTATTEGALDADVEALEAQLAQAPNISALGDLLVHAMAPSRHWMPAGLLATRRFVQLSLG
jgi:hypothetical protein